MSKAHRIFAGLATVLLASSLVACSGGGAIATVNGQPISQADFDAKLEASQAARGTLQQMVQAALIDQYAKDNNISVSDADIKAKEDALKANFPTGSWDDMLKSRGLTETDVHNLLREQIILDRAVGKNITISNAQIAAYFAKNHAQFDKPEQVRARHILLPDLATANKVEGLLKKGGNFAALAQQYSMDPGTKSKGGELGWFRHGQMVPAFDQAAFSLPIGQISQPVKSPFGYHIIQVEERQPGVTATLANSSSKIADLLRQQQEGPLIAPFISNLQAKANIQINDPRFADLFPSPPPGAPAASAAPASAAPASAPPASAAASPSPAST